METTTQRSEGPGTQFELLSMKRSPSVKIFDVYEVRRAIDRLNEQEKELQRLSAGLRRCLDNDGRREFVLPPSIWSGGLRDALPNFSPVIEHVETEFALAGHIDLGEFSMQPILLDGPPGIGKTWFCQNLANAIGVPLIKISMGAMQGSFDIVGTSHHWSNTSPGQILNAMADGDIANPVLLLDELDKCPRDDRYSIIPALLDLTDPRQARGFQDQSCGLRFDASKMLIIGTSNDKRAIPAALAQRFFQFDCAPPTRGESMEIAANIWSELTETLDCSQIELQPGSVDLVVDAGLAPRQIFQVFRQAIGRALLKNHAVATVVLPQQAVRQRRVGFV